MTAQENFDLDLERAILSTCYYSEEAYTYIDGDIEPSDFKLQAHQDIFSAMIACVNAHEPISYAFLKKHKNIDEAALAAITGTTTVVDIVKYATELREMAIKRHLMSFALTMPARIKEEKPISDITEGINQELFTLTNRIHRNDIKDAPLIIRELLEEFERQKASENKEIVGLDTGFSELNKKIKGFKNGDLIIIAARPGMGKTTIALNFIDKVLKNRQGVVLFSLEMPAVQIMQRLIAAKTSIPLQKIISVDLTDTEWERVIDACNYYSDSPLFIYDSGYVSISEVRAVMRKLCEQRREDGGIALCVVDYIGLMMSSGKFTERHLQVSEISRGLKLLARQLKLPIIALSQLNRGLESRANKRPMLSDLRESGAIEQDADTILFVYRDEIYREQEEQERENRAKAEGIDYKRKFTMSAVKEPAELIIGKNRNGPTGTVKLEFHKENSTFVEVFDDISVESQSYNE